jgi:hypothetical protein
MFTSNQQIVVDSQQGNTYGPMDMEVGAVGMGCQKKVELCKQTFIKHKSLWTNLYIYLWDMAITMTTTLQNSLNSPKIGLVIYAFTHYYEDFWINSFFEILIFIVYYNC